MRTRESSRTTSCQPLPVNAQAKLQLPRSVALQESTAPEHSPRARTKDIKAGSFGCMWFSILVKSKYIAPRTLLLLRCEQPKVQTQALHLQWLRAALNCRNYEFLDSWENSVYTSVLKLGNGDVRTVTQVHAEFSQI
jgi:hypothetical protein